MKNSGLNILLLRFGSPCQLDGVNKFLYVLYEALRKLNNNAIIIGGYKGTCDLEIVKQFFDIDIVPHIEFLTEHSTNRLKLLYNWAKKGSRLIKEFEPDIVIANGVIPIPTIGFRILMIHDVPERFHQILLSKLIIKRYHLYAFNSTVTRDEFLRKFDVKPAKAIIVPLPIYISKYVQRPLSEREHALLFIDGRGRRNLHFALKVFKLIARLDNDVIMYVVGAKNLPSAEYPKDRAICLGMVDVKTLRSLYSRTKLLIIPSSYEGFGYPVLEAFASGTPVVGSHKIPRELLIDSFNGFRVSSFDYKLYADACLRLLKDEENWLKLSNGALRTAKEHDAEAVALRFIGLYERLADAPRDT